MARRKPGSPVMAVFWPLALSWLFMAAEGPLLLSVLSRAPDTKLNTAAIFVLFSLAIFIESPVIDLLSTATTFIKGPKSLASMRKFSLWVSIGTSVAHALIMLTPAGAWVMRELLHQPPEIVEMLRVPFIIMIPWSVSIGWRRFHQGALIRAKQTRAITVGTIFRMTMMAVVGFGVVSTGAVGVVAAACALVSGVAVEAVVAHVAATRLLRGHFVENDQDSELATKTLLRFHAPLTAATMTTLLAGPMIAAAIASLPDSIANQAAWQVGFVFIWLIRTVTFALPEVVIRMSEEQSALNLFYFSFKVGAMMSAIGLCVSLSGWSAFIFQRLFSVEAEIATRANEALLWGSSLPVLNAIGNWAKGLLASYHETLSRMLAVIFGIVALKATLMIGVASKANALFLVSGALFISLIGEGLILSIGLARHSRKAKAAQAELSPQSESSAG